MSEVINLGKFTNGINNIAKETSLPENSLREAINVDVDDVGNVRLREGYNLVYNGTNISSLYNSFFKEENNLKFLNDDYTATVIATDITGRINYTEINGSIYWTDGSKNGVISNLVNSELGIPTPLLVGNTPNDNDVQITYAYRDQTTGELSGADLALANATSYEKIGYDLVQYKTTGDDGRLYDSDGRICNTQFMSQIPSGQIIEYYKGKIYVASDNTLWFSQPFRYGLCKTSSDFFSFPSRINICIAVDSGIYVVADKTYFITFSKTEEAHIKEVSQETAVEGTGLKISGADLGFEFESELAYWFSDMGAMVGLPNGQTQNLTSDRVAVPDSTSKVGTSIYKEYNSIKQIISSMPVGGEVSSMQSQDNASATIIRNGITI